MLGIFSNIKVAIVAAGAAVVAGLLFMLKLTQSKNKKLTEDNRVLEGNLAVKDEQLEDTIDAKDFEINRGNDEALIDEEAEADLEADIDTIDDIPDGEDFKVDL